MMDHKINVHAEPEEFEEILKFCREKFGHRGKDAGWWWNVRGKWKDGNFVFAFRSEEDAIIFKLSKGIS